MRKERIDGQKTREASLAAATEVFAEKGFEGTSTRDICARAGVNNALVNRYYGTKDNLYRIVAKSLFGDLGAPLAKLADGVDSQESWQNAIRTWIDDFLYMTLPQATAQKRCSILFREEITHPTRFIQEFRNDFGRPIFHALKRLFAMALADENEILLWTSSVWAQVSAYALADPIWHKDFRPKGMSNVEWAASIRDHICEQIFRAVSYREGK